MNLDRKKPVNVISSHALDIITYAGKRGVTKRPGGPALWITQALREMGVACRLYTGKKPAQVHIDVKNGEESGRIVSVDAIARRTFDAAPLSIVSTIGAEFDITRVGALPGFVAVDVQGYVRTHDRRKGILTIPPHVQDKIDILKATEEEASRLSPQTLRTQKKRVLLITRGKKGFIVYANGKKHTYRVASLKTKDAIGAGDTFFTAFAVSYCNTRDVRHASIYAQEQVERFLINKDTRYTGIPHQLPGAITTVQEAKRSKRDILLLTYVHGNEPLGYRVLKRLKENPATADIFDWLIANPPAVLQNKRFVDRDLNREAPGDALAREYETRRAAELLRILAEYRYVIDLHQTRANSRTIIILPEVSESVLQLVRLLDVRDILFWPSKKKNRKASLVSFVPRGIGLETGTKHGYARAEKRVAAILTAFGQAVRNEDKDATEENFSQKHFYYVYGNITPADVPARGLKDFGLTHGTDGDFIALLFGKHAKKLGYKMRRIDVKLMMRYARRRVR